MATQGTPASINNEMFLICGAENPGVPTGSQFLATGKVVVVVLPLPVVVVVISSLAGVEQPPNQRTNDQDIITKPIPIANNQNNAFFVILAFTSCSILPYYILFNYLYRQIVKACALAAVRL
jgi:hypothetical protein